MARIDDLRWLAGITKASIEESDPDRRGPLINQYRATLAEIDQLAGAASKVGDPLDEISARRTARGGATARSGRAVRESR